MIAATPLRTEAPTEAVPRSRNIDTSGTFAKGFNRDEALRLFEPCLNLNNPDDGAAYAADTSAWEPIYPDAADKPADVLDPWQNAWKLWRSKTEAKTYAVVIRGTMEDETSIIRILSRGPDESVYLTIDGQVGTPIREHDTLVCHSTQHALHLIRPPRQMFFDVLRQKLKWGER